MFFYNIFLITFLKYNNSANPANENAMGNTNILFENNIPNNVNIKRVENESIKSFNT